MVKLTFKQLSNSYQEKNTFCEKSLGKIYSLKTNHLNNISCNRITCQKCRPRLKNELHENIVRQVIEHDLNRHLIITFPGKKERLKYGYQKSYRIMNHEWNKLRNVILYKYPDFEYIVLPRAQADPMPGNPAGFCHYHLLMGEYIPKEWLDKKVKKYCMGYTSINYNQDLADYLCKDFFEDTEWHIPYDIKHYRSSRSILINVGNGYKKNEDNIYFTPQMPLNDIETTINAKYSLPLPFEEYVKQFIDSQNKEQPLLPGQYINGELKQISQACLQGVNK